MFSDDDETVFNVVLNHEEQYSIWPAYKETPLGWNETGKSGLKADCLDFIGLVWTNMQPLSLQHYMKELAAKTARGELVEEVPEDQSWNEGPTLVERLSQGLHPVEACVRPETTVDGFKECIDRGFVHVKFTGTRGGTELGFNVDKDASDLGSADFSAKTGAVHLEGELTLDYQPVRCVVDLDLDSLSGEGSLEVVKEHAVS